MATLLGHRQTKGAATDKPDLLPPRHISTLPGVAGCCRAQPTGRDQSLAVYSGRWPHNGARAAYLGMSTAIQTAGTVPRFSAQCVVARPSAIPSPACATVSGLPSW